MTDEPGIPTTCEHCGGPLEQGVALVNTRGGCVRMPLPPRCPSEACRAARDEEAIADAIARGIIDP